MEPREIRCQKCGAEPGRPCRTTHGALTGTHTVRVEHARYEVEQRPLPDAHEAKASAGA